jgi:hypothetical protein
MPQMQVWNIFYNVPLDREITIPLILLPEIHVLIKINSANHLCYSTELTTCINLNKNNKKRGIGYYFGGSKGMQSGNYWNI